MKILNSFLDFINKIVEYCKSLDWSTIITWGVLGLIVIAILIILISFLVNYARGGKFFERVKYSSMASRVYRINSLDQTVVYFDLSNVENKKKVPLEKFYSFFAKEDKEKIEKWIENTLAGKQTPDFLQTNIYLDDVIRKGGKRKTIPSLLKITKSDPTYGLLHLENCIIQNNEKKKVNAHLNPIVSENEFASKLKANGTNRGTTFCFNIRRKKIGGYDTNIPKQISSKFRIALDRFIGGNVSLLKLSDYELLVCNYDISDNDEAVLYGLKAVNGVTNALLGKGKPEDFPYVIKAGIVANKDTFGDTESIIDCSTRSAVSAYDTSASLYVYRKGVDSGTALDVTKYRSEVEKIIQDKRITNLYQPVYGVVRHTVIGYMAMPTPDADRTSFGTIEELKNYAIRAKDHNNLFNYLAKSNVSRFIAERPLRSQRLFFPVMVRELETIPAIYSNLKGAKEANVTFLIRETEAFASIKQRGEENFLSLIKNIHDEGFKVGLIVQGQSINVDMNILNIIDIFFVDFKNEDIDSKHMDTIIRSQLHALVEKLLKFSKIIVGINLPDWNAIELVVGSGIDYVSSNQFGPYQNGFLPLKEKDEIRLNEMKGLRK